MPRDKAVMAALDNAHVGDTRSYSPKTGEYIVRHGYFYRHGMTEDKLAAEVTAAVPQAKITKAIDHYAAWPRDSYFEVRFKI